MRPLVDSAIGHVSQAMQDIGVMERVHGEHVSAEYALTQKERLRQVLKSLTELAELAANLERFGRGERPEGVGGSE